MRSQTILAIAITGLFTTCIGYIVNGKNSLKVNPRVGVAPLKVVITGPLKLLESSPQTRLISDKSSHYIDWGDIPQPKRVSNFSNNTLDPRILIKEQDPLLDFQHTYDQAGTYTIRAAIFHLGPQDEMVSDWSDSIRIRVE